MAKRREAIFIPIPAVRNTLWTCTIDGTDVRDYILDGYFPRGLVTEELVCEVVLDNSGNNFTDSFSQGDEIIFTMTLNGDGTTVQFKGEIEKIDPSFEGGFFKLKIKGAHYTARLLDVMVNEDFSGTGLSSIRTYLMGKYATDFTTNNVQENTTPTSIKFVDKPLLDCLADLDSVGEEDSYIDDDKDLHTFDKNSQENTNIHFSLNDSLLSLSGLGTDSVDVRNKITVYGESDGIPVIHASEDSPSQSTYRLKEKVITEQSAKTETQAQEVGDAELSQLKDPKAVGSCKSLFWDNINPGDSAYVISGEQLNVHGKYRIVKYAFSVPSEQMDVFFNNEKSIPKLFKDRIKKSQGQESINNPFGMTRSYVFPFDDTTNLDTDASSGYIIENGYIRKDPTVESAIIYSDFKDSDVTANSASLRAVGEFLDGADYSIQADTSAVPQSITPNDTSALSVTNPGTDVRLKIVITSDNTRINSAGLYWKS